MRTTKAQMRLTLELLASVAAQASLCLAWSETPEDMFSRDKAHAKVAVNQAH